MNRIIFFTFLFFSMNTLYGQNSIADLDTLVPKLIMEGKFKEAEPLAKELVQQSTNQQDTFHAKRLSLLGEVYQRLGKYDESLKMHEKSRTIIERIVGQEHILYAKSLNSSAICYTQQSQYEQALEYLEKSKKIHFKIAGKGTLDYSKSILNIGIVYYYMGLHKESEFYIKNAKEIQEKIIGREHAEYARTLNCLGVLYWTAQRNEEALAIYTESKNIRERQYGKDHYLYGESLNNIGLVYERMSKYRKAVQYYTQAKEIREATLGKEHNYYAQSLNNLSGVYEMMKQYDKAKTVQEEAAKLINGKTLDYAVNQFHLAKILVAEENYEEGNKVLENNAMLLLGLVGEHHHIYLQNSNFLGESFSKQGDLENAEYYYMKSIAAALGEDTIVCTIDWIETLNTKKYWSGKEYYAALVGLTDTKYAVYEKYGDIEDLKKAFLLCRESILIGHNLRHSLSTKDDKLAIVRTHLDFVTRGIKIAKELHEKFPNEAYLEAAFQFAEENKSMILSDALQAHNAKSMSDLPKEMILEEQNLQKELSNLKTKMIQKITSDEYNQLVIKLNALYAEIEAFQAKIKAEYPKYYALRYQANFVDVKALQANLTTGQVLLEYSIMKDKIYVFYLGNSSIELKELNIKSSVFNMHVRRLRYSLTNYRFIADRQEAAYESYTQHAHWFYKELIEPVLANKKDIKDLVVIADKELNYLPFEAFLTEVAPQALDYQNIAYLINEYTISYDYSAKLLLENSARKAGQNNRRVLAMGASYPEQGKAQPKVTKTRSAGDIDYLSNVRSSLTPLAAVNDEINQLSGYFKGNFRLGKAANEAYFKQNAQEYSVIHLAMHGILHEQIPILSSMAFTDNQDTLEDNFLQAYEISNLKLNSDLIVLSACETGYGKFIQGEGVLSLARSFMYAGTPSLVVSLWEVNDQSTLMLMKDFYQELRGGKKKSTALRQAKLNYIQNVEGVAGHPIFWSAFVQIGDSKPLRLVSKSGGLMSYIWIIVGGLTLVGIVIGARRFIRFGA